MAGWPQTALPVYVDIAPGAAAAGDPSGAAFTDVTTDVFQVADQIEIASGRGDWGKEADPGTCSATFYNTSGDYSEFNPNGQWYGLLGKDTPLRTGLKRVSDGFDNRTLAAGWGTSPDGEVWSGYGAGGTLLSTDTSVSAGVARHSVPAAVASRSNWLSGVHLADVRVRVGGAKLPFTDVTGGNIELGNITLRMQDISTMYLIRVEVTPTEAVTVTIYNPAGTLLATTTVAGLTHSAAQTLEIIGEISGDQIRAKVWATGADEPGGWTLTATDNTLLLPGGVGVRTGVGPGNTNTKPIVATYDSVTVYADLFGGWVPAWVPRSDISGKLRTVPVNAKGALYRTQPATGKSPELSPFRRLIMSTPGLLAYWPCEDLPGSVQIASAIPGAAPMTVSDPDDVDFAGDPAEAGGSGFAQRGSSIGYTNLIQPGTKALPNLAAGGRFYGVVPRVGTSSPVEWSVCFLARTNSLQAGKEILLAEWETPGGTYKIHRLYQTAGGTIALFGIDANDVGWSLLGWSDATFSLTEYRVEAGTIGTSAQLNLWVDGVLKDSAVFGSTTLKRVTTVTANPNLTSVTGVTGWWVGHIQVWDTSTPPPLGQNSLSLATADTDSYGEPFWPFFRHLNETSHDRLERLFGQDNIPVFIPPVDADQVTRMGPQPDGTPSDLYRECERTDGGVLYERPFALGYQPRAALYAQAPALELSTADLSSAPAPDGTRQRYRNRWQVNRPDGSYAVAESDDVEAGAIVADESEDINTATETVLTDQASWRLHLADSKDLRWPVLEFDLWTAPELLDKVLNLRPGSRITVSDSPADVAGQDIDVIFEGWTVTLGYKSFAVTANCSPAAPWRVAVVGDFRPDSDTAVVAANAANNAASISVNDPAGAWITSAADPGSFPLDIDVAGDWRSCTAITGTGPQTFTIGPSLNGVTKSFKAGARVRLRESYVVGL